MAGTKVMLLGSVGVGKTSIANRLAFNRFDGNYKATIGVDVYTASVTPAGAAAVPLMIWDTDGDFGQTIFSGMYLRGAAAAVMVADLSRPHTITHAMTLVTGFQDALPGRPSMVVLNKADLVQDPLAVAGGMVEGADLLAAASARTGDGVNAAFEQLAEILLRRGL